jgi:hypothetical protein
MESLWKLYEIRLLVTGRVSQHGRRLYVSSVGKHSEAVRKALSGPRRGRADGLDEPSRTSDGQWPDVA